MLELPPVNTPPRYWRSLGERHDTPEFREWLEWEFPPLASEWTDEISRRRFVQLMGASFALAGLGACTKQPIEKIVPYVRQPEEVLPGRPLHFATAMTLGGYARGVIVESHEGRPTKIEGNPQHPGSLGATDVYMQASVLDLYDPDRSQTVLYGTRADTWERFEAMIDDALAVEAPSGGAGVRILTQTVTSPTLGAQMAALLRRYPAARWHQWEPVNRDNVREGARLAFGTPVETVYRFDKAEVILALSADFLGQGPGQLRYARDFADRRRISAGAETFSRLYVAEPTPTITGASADWRVPMSEAAISAAALEWGNASWLARAARELASHKGAGIVIAGDTQPPQVHAAVHAINASLGNAGNTALYVNSPEAQPVNQLQSLRELVADMSAGRVQVLIILGGNPVFDAPADLAFGVALQRVKLRIHHGLHANETAELCHWHVPESHYLEAWGDARAYDGTASIIQPLIQPLYESRSAHELVALLLGDTNPVGYQIVRDYWRGQGLDDTRWTQCLRDGVIPGTASAPAAATLSTSPPLPIATGAPGGLEANFRPDPSVYDGRFANNGWLQELPKPLTTLTWDNAILIAPATAHRLGLESEDMVELEANGRMVRGPVFLMPGQAEGSLTLHMGYGAAFGEVAKGAGFDVYPLRTAENLHAIEGAHIEKLGTRRPLAVVHQQHGMHGRDLLRVASLEEYRRDPKFAQAGAREPGREETLYHPEEHPYNGYSWGMSIDLTACIGCNACVIACQAENNIPVVGKEQVAARARDALDSRGRLFRRRRRTIRRCTFNRCHACIAKTRHASWSVPWARRCMTTRA